MREPNLVNAHPVVQRPSEATRRVAPIPRELTPREAADAFRQRGYGGLTLAESVRVADAMLGSVPRRRS